MRIASLGLMDPRDALSVITEALSLAAAVVALRAASKKKKPRLAPGNIK